MKISWWTIAGVTVLMLLLSSCRTLTDMENKRLDRERERIEKPKIPEVRP